MAIRIPHASFVGAKSPFSGGIYGSIKNVDLKQRGAIIDLDGTVYTGGNPINGAAELIQTFRDAGFQLLFLTNTAVRSRQSYSEKLAGLGIRATPEEILTSGVVTAQYLSHNHPQCTPLAITHLGTNRVASEST
jgi:HAD superfamily hydrolase (TIGR01450 family)